MLDDPDSGTEHETKCSDLVTEDLAMPHFTTRTSSTIAAFDNSPNKRLNSRETSLRSYREASLHSSDMLPETCKQRSLIRNDLIVFGKCASANCCAHFAFCKWGPPHYIGLFANCKIASADCRALGAIRKMSSANCSWHGACN